MDARQRPIASLDDDTATADSLGRRDSLKMRGAALGEFGEIVVFVDGQTETAGVLELAGELAREHGAHLTGVFMQPLPSSTPPETFARGTGILGVIEAHRAQLEGIEAGHRALFDDIVRRHAIRSEWRSVPYLSPGPPHPGGMERRARGRPGGGGRPAIAGEGRGGRGVDRRP